jgi:hypothetical protein
MKVIRLRHNPIVRPDMLAGEEAANINGPSLIRAPGWLDRPLARYYLYFAHHSGRYLRLAVADELTGPWRVHAPGTLRLEQTPCSGHVTSPDVHVDPQRRKVRMYYHGLHGDPAGGRAQQLSFVAFSDNGLAFRSAAPAIAPFYLRAFRHAGEWFGLAKHRNAGAVLVGSPDGLKPFRVIRRVLPRARHTAVRVRDRTADIFLSRAGDAPEHIMVSRMSLEDPPPRWRPGEPASLLRPQRPWEGAGLPNEPSKWGQARGPVCQLRDPAVYEEADRTYLLYSVAGESGIAIAEIVD